MKICSKNTGVPVMKIRTLLATCLAGGVLATTSAYADHNSVWGEGWANMPNDIHNTRIEDDNETFHELVQGGGGADSVNRYADDTTTTMGGSRSRMTTTMGGSRTTTVSRGGRR